MSIELRIARLVWTEMHRDLSQPHPFAFERVGFLMAAQISTPTTAAIRLDVTSWERVEDADYLRDDRVGASIGPEAFRKILQRAHFDILSILHVHRHDHHGTPAFSNIDTRAMRSFIPSFFNAQGSRPHGALLLSLDNAIGLIRQTKNARDLPINRIVIQ